MGSMHLSGEIGVLPFFRDLALRSCKNRDSLQLCINAIKSTLVIELSGGGGLKTALMVVQGRRCGVGHDTIPHWICNLMTERMLTIIPQEAIVYHSESSQRPSASAFSIKVSCCKNFVQTLPDKRKSKIPGQSGRICTLSQLLVLLRMLDAFHVLKV